MTIAIETSLFEPSGGTVLESSLAWIDATLFGSVAIGLCMLAVALVGALALTGRLPLREGLRVVIGCFVLLGAPVVAAGLLGAINGQKLPPISAPPAVTTEQPREELEPASFDPYAGASLRSD